MRGCEIKQLRWQDIDLLEKTLTIRKSKTEAGERVIPLNTDGWNTTLLLYRRAQGFGEVRPEHYVFPACEASHLDPTRPQTSWRTAWRNLTRLIQCPACGKQQGPAEACGIPQCKADLKKVKSVLAGLRFHDLRHYAITELAESQASDSTVMAIAGHVSPKMLAHYSHVRLQAKRTALDSLSTKRPERDNSGGKAGGYDTIGDTKQHAAESVHPQVIENLVELVGIEPTTSSLRTMRSPS
jgi:integrase